MSSAANPILLVEDDEDDVFAFKRAIKKTAVPVALQVARNGQEAIDYLAGTGDFSDRTRHPLPRLVFLDLKLPLVNGFGVLTWIRQSAQFAGMSVVVLSGSDEASDHETAKRLGAQSYLVKPATPAHLAAAMAQ